MARVLSALGCRAVKLLIPTRWLRQSLDHLIISLADQCVKNEDYRQALVHYQHALVVAECLGDQASQAELMGDLAGASLALSDYKKARSYSQKAVKLARVIGDKEGEATALINLGGTCLYLGLTDEAVECFKQARATTLETGGPGEIIALTNLGSAYNLTGQFDKAIACLHEAEVLTEAQGDREGAGFCWINLADIHSNLGNYSKATKCGEQAVALMEGLERKRGQWLALVSLGNALADWGDACESSSEKQAKWQEASQCFDRAAQVAGAPDDREGQLMALLNQATVLIRQEKLEAAIAELGTRALPLAQAMGDRRVEAYCYINRADAQVRVGKRQEQESPGTGKPYFDQAKADYRQALSQLEAAADDRGKRSVHSKLGDLYAHWLDEKQQAYQSYETAMELWERTRGLLMEEEHRVGFLGRGLDAYYGMIHLCIKTGRPAEALSTAERVRSRTLLELLAYSRIRPPEINDPSLLAREEELVTELQGLSYALRHEDDEERRILTQRMSNLKRKWDELLDQIEALAPDYVALRRGTPLSFEAIKASLD